MGIFNRKPKKQKQQVAGHELSSHEAISDWLNSDDMDKEGFMRREFERGKKLMQSKDENVVHQGYNIVGPVAAMGYVPAMMLMGDFCENSLGKMEQAATWYMRSAAVGSAEGCRCYADMLMTGKGIARDAAKAMEFYRKAANGGVPESMFVMGEYYRNAGEREIALDWYRKSHSSGYEPALTRIRQMESGER